MQFEQVYQRLNAYQRETQGWFVHMAETALRAIYNHIIATKAKDCLELGTAFGGTTCVMAAAAEENGGTVTTIDIIERKPVGVRELAHATGLSANMRMVTLDGGYNWFLRDVMLRQTRGRVCEPCYDFCFLDGAHLWEPDALAILLVKRLLRPGGWLLLDDLNWTPKNHPGWETAFHELPEEALTVTALGDVFDLVLKGDPDFDDFVLTNEGRMGWCRKRGGTADQWLPDRIVSGPLGQSWSETLDGFAAFDAMPHSETVTVEPQGRAALLRSTGADPQADCRVPAERRPIDHITLRLRLLSPRLEVLQLFWIGGDDWYFSEDHSLRCHVRAWHETQELTFRMIGSERERTIKGLRLDPGDGACQLLVESVTFGAR